MHSTWGAGSKGLSLLLMAHILKSCSWPPVAQTFFVRGNIIFLLRQIHWITWSSDERCCKSFLSWITNDENSNLTANAVFPAATWQCNISAYAACTSAKVLLSFSRSFLIGQIIVLFLCRSSTQHLCVGYRMVVTGEWFKILQALISS